MTKRLSVRLYKRPVGILEQIATGKMTFHYLPEAKQAISLSMPVRLAHYDNVACEAYFGGLLPESPQVRNAIARQFAIKSENSFSLLRAIGYDCAGAVAKVNSMLHNMGYKVQIAEKIQQHLEARCKLINTRFIW